MDAGLNYRPAFVIMGYGSYYRKSDIRGCELYIFFSVNNKETGLLPGSVSFLFERKGLEWLNISL